MKIKSLSSGNLNDKLNALALICDCCGGAINSKTMVCAYCGTKYMIKDDQPVLRIEHQSSPVRVLKMQTAVPEELLRDGCMAKESVTNMVMGDIRKQLAKALEDMMTIEMQYDARQMRQVITARVRVLEPDVRFSDYMTIMEGDK